MPAAPAEKSAVLSSVSKALEKGALSAKRWHVAGRHKRPHSWLADYSGTGKLPCSAPITIERTGRVLTKPGESRRVVVSIDQPAKLPVLVEYKVPCRKCTNCLKRRSRHWYLRALSETKKAQRTWFGTLTLSPDQHVRVAAACRVYMATNGDDFDALPGDKQFLMRHKAISRELTLYFKRLRKESGAEFKFLCVVEAHKSGLPHYHVLLHEAVGPSVVHATLSKQWRVGFSNWKLVSDPQKVGYVTKYLAKSMLARVRPSIDYGKG